MEKCRICGIELDTRNWYPSLQKGKQRCCKTCWNINRRIYKKENKGKCNEYHRKWRDANREHWNSMCNENTKRWNKLHPELYLQRNRETQKRFKERHPGYYKKVVEDHE